MLRSDLFTVVAIVVAVLGVVRLLTCRDLIQRIIALNVASGGVLMTLLVVATQTGDPDAVPHALALTGIVITVSVTGLALVIVRKIEAAEAAEVQEAREAERSETQDEARESERSDAGDTAQDSGGPT